MNYFSLFSGIGGIDLGLDRAGMTCVGQVEKDPWCQRVLAKHWPEVPRHDDVRTAVEWWLGRTRPAVGLVAGGFPCQPFSTAGRREGVGDERWGWPWFWAVVRALRPRFVLVENVAALVADRHAFGLILGDLAAGGYDAEWDCVPAAAVGAPHLRDRLFLVAYADGAGRDGCAELQAGRHALRRAAEVRPEPHGRRPRLLADANRQPLVWTSVPRPERNPWAAEPDVGRVADGVPARVDRLKGLGNAVVPHVAEHVGRLIMAAAA